MDLVDIHCHLMPYVDDGAADLQESLELLEEEAAQGVREICLTPHLRSGMFRSTDDTVRERYEELCTEVEHRKLPLRLHLSREYFYDDSFRRRLSSGNLIPMGSHGVILTEFRYSSDPSVFPQAAEEVFAAGFRPLFAHVERYHAVQQDPDLIRRLYDRGVLIQLNAASILRKEGLRQWFTVRRLLKEDLVHVVASDAHNMTDRRPNLCICKEYLCRKYGEERAERLLHTVPLRLLDALPADKSAEK